MKLKEEFNGLKGKKSKTQNNKGPLNEVK